MPHSRSCPTIPTATSIWCWTILASRQGLARDRRNGCQSDEADPGSAGQYEEPVRIVAFNTAEGWSRDVTEEIAAELAQACANRDEMRRSVADFIADHR